MIERILAGVLLVSIAVAGLAKKEGPPIDSIDRSSQKHAALLNGPIHTSTPPATDQPQQPVNVKNYGVYGDGTTNDREALNGLVNVKLRSGGDVFFPEGDYSIQSDLSFPAHVNLIFATGARLKPGKRTTITINGTVTAPPTQIFLNAVPGEGTISFTSSTTLTGVFPTWWQTNAIPGETDMTGGVQAAINTGRTVILPEGVFGITNVTVGHGSQRIVGSGPQITLLKALSAGKVISISGSRTHLSFFSINGNQKADYGIYLANNASRTTLDNIEIYNIMGDPGEGIGNEGRQNYLTHITDCEIESCKTGIHLIPSAQGSVIDRCKIFDNSRQGVYLGNGKTTLYDISIINSEIEMSTAGGVAKYNVVVDKVSPLMLNGIYFESAAHANSADVKVVSADSVIRMDGIYATGNDIANFSVVLDAAVNLSISNYSCNGYMRALPIDSISRPGRFVKLDNVDFNGDKKVLEIYNGNVVIPRLVQNYVTVPSGSTTPDVSNGNVFVYPASGVAVTINQFLNGSEGQIITLINLSPNNITITRENCLLSHGVDAVLTQASSIQLLRLGSKWYEIGRSIVAR